MIEAALNRLPQVQEAAVLARNDQSGARRIVAYVVPSGPLDRDRLQALLEPMLPEDVPPISYVLISALPLDRSGKVDGDALGQLPVLDADLVDAWETRLRSLPEIRQVAVLPEDGAEHPGALHLSDLLPDWRRSTSRETDHAQTSPARPQEPQEQPGSDSPAVSHGGPLQWDAGSPRTLPAALRRAAQASSAKGVLYVQADGTEIVQSYPDLLEHAERIMAGLRKLGLRPQDKVLFQLDRNEDFIPAFWGCVLGGFVPVPVSIAPTYSSANGAVSKLHNAWQLLDQPLVVAGSALAPAVQSLSAVLGIRDFRVCTVDELARSEPGQVWHECQPLDLALLMLTSGSTGMPKAVKLSHHNLLARAVGSERMNGFSSSDVSLNWMPLDHVAGIIYFHIRDVYLGCQQVHGPSELVLQDPLKWLDWIERYSATITFAPNFAFGLVNDRAEDIGRRRWNLSSARYVLNGAEAIVARTARRFLQLLRPHGLPSTAIHPAWGMSETSSGVVYSDRFSADSAKDDDAFVEVGAPIPGFSMRIVDAQDRVLSEGSVGRLQVSGDQVTSGYFGNAELNQEAFTADGWFKTGDLGMLRSGRMTITGREKNVIIIHGANFYSHEIEAVVEEIDGVETSFTAACAVRGEGVDTDRLAIFFHPATEDDEQLGDLLKTIRETVGRKIGVLPAYLIPVEKQDIPKTTIGKIQHAQLSSAFEAGEFESKLKRVDVLTGNVNTLPAWFYRKVWRRKDLIPDHEARAGLTDLVFLDGAGLGMRLRDDLARPDMPCVGVEAGPDFDRIAPDHYRIDPRNAEHYGRLLESMTADGRRIEQVLHLWTCDPASSDVSTVEELKRTQDRGVYSLLFLIQALAQRPEPKGRVQLSVASSRSQAVLPGDEVEYTSGAILGLLRTAPQEMPWLACRHVDLPVDEARINAERLLAELRATPRDREVAYRGGERWIPRLKLERFQDGEKRSLPFKPGGMYLLSGGLGGIGVEIARYLLKEHGAKVLLVGRTPLTPLGPSGDARGSISSERIQAYRELEQLPGSVSYAAVDVCDVTKLREVVEQAKRRWSTDLDGVIHLAGSYHERLLAEETRDTFASILDPKLLGAWALSRLLGDGPERVFVCFSSLSGHFGGALVGAYSAASSALESFAQYRRRVHPGRNHCLEWSTWDDVGMSRGNPIRELMRSRGYQAISSGQGLQSLLAVLCHEHADVLVGLDGSVEHVRKHVDPGSDLAQRLRAYVALKDGCALGARSAEISITDRFGTAVECGLQPLSQLPLTDAGAIDRDKLSRLPHGRDQLTRELVPPRTETERRIAGFWREVLAVPQVGIRDKFSELGGDSLLATQIGLRIHEAFRVHLTLRTMLEASTIEQLAVVVERRQGELATREVPAVDRIESADAKSLLQRLDRLSNEEVNKLLSQALKRGDKR